MKLQQYAEVIVQFLKDKLIETKMQGYVLGVSGGIDSALVALLAKKAVGDKLFCLILPCESHPSDAKDAIELLKTHHINYQIIDLSSAYHALVKETEQNEELSNLAKSNIKVRLRMVTLYAIAQNRHSLVLGTDNWDESYIGYFTKYGDGAADLLPIVELTKEEVFILASDLGVTEAILKRKPSAGLYVNQTDEDEIGVSYKEIDNYLLGIEVSKESKERIEYLHRASQHKRDPIPRPSKFIRD